MNKEKKARKVRRKTLLEVRDKLHEALLLLREANRR